MLAPTENHHGPHARCTIPHITHKLLLRSTCFAHDGVSGHLLSADIDGAAAAVRLPPAASACSFLHQVSPILVSFRKADDRVTCLTTRHYQVSPQVCCRAQPHSVRRCYISPRSGSKIVTSQHHHEHADRTAWRAPLSGARSGAASHRRRRGTCPHPAQGLPSP